MDIYTHTYTNGVIFQTVSEAVKYVPHDITSHNVKHWMTLHHPKLCIGEIEYMVISLDRSVSCVFFTDLCRWTPVLFLLVFEVVTIDTPFIGRVAYMSAVISRIYRCVQ